MAKIVCETCSSLKEKTLSYLNYVGVQEIVVDGIKQKLEVFECMNCGQTEMFESLTIDLLDEFEMQRANSNLRGKLTNLSVDKVCYKEF